MGDAATASILTPAAINGCPGWIAAGLERGQEIRTIQELLGHKDVKTSMLYTQALNRGPLEVRSHEDLV